MGEKRLVDKALGPAEVLRALQAGSITISQAQQLFPGTLPIGSYRGIASVLDLDLLVVQPLILAEKQWTLDKIDTRNGLCTVSVPIGSTISSIHTAEIEVPADEVWYLCEHEIEIPATAAFAAADVQVNFRVSSFPQIGGVDKAYYDVNDPQVYLTTPAAGVPGIVASGGLVATAAEIAAGDVEDHRLVAIGHTLGVPDLGDVKRDFRDGDELNTELRLIGGDILTLVVTVLTAITAGAILPVNLRVWGRVGKLLVT